MNTNDLRMTIKQTTESFLNKLYKGRNASNYLFTTKHSFSTEIPKMV